MSDDIKIGTLPVVEAPALTFDVSFFNKALDLSAGRRVNAANASSAIEIAIIEMGSQLDKVLSWEVRVRTVDVAAEAKHLADYAPLYEERDDAIAEFEKAGFTRAVGTQWFKHDETGLAAIIDVPEGLIGQRYAGIYMHRIDEETGKDMMFAWAIIPWYGDGAWHGRAVELLRKALQIAIS